MLSATIYINKYINISTTNIGIQINITLVAAVMSVSYSLKPNLTMSCTNKYVRTCGKGELNKSITNSGARDPFVQLTFITV